MATNNAINLASAGVCYYNGAGTFSGIATSTASQILLSGASAAPSWSTSTYPSTNAVNTLLYASATNVMSALATANNGALITNGSGVPSIGTVPIAAGGTNATSMGTSNGIVKYDGTRLVTSTTALIDSNNRMTNGSQPCFLYYCNAAVTNVTGDGTNYTCLFQTQVFDNGSNFSSNTTFTAPVTGMYQFNMSVLTQNNLAAHNPSFRLVVNGSTNYTFGNFGGAFVGNFLLHSSIVIKMNATDTCTVVLQTSNSTKTVGVYGASGDCRTYFSGYLVC